MCLNFKSTFDTRCPRELEERAEKVTKIMKKSLMTTMEKREEELHVRASVYCFKCTCTLWACPLNEFCFPLNEFYSPRTSLLPPNEFYSPTFRSRPPSLPSPEHVQPLTVRSLLHPTTFVHLDILIINLSRL